MSISRLQKERLFHDEELFNELLSYAEYDEDYKIFFHTDTSFWAIFRLQPLGITKVSDNDAFQTAEAIQELFDTFDTNIAVQVNWITSFEIESLLKENLNAYPLSGPAGWMARRWIRSIRNAANSSEFGLRPKKLDLLFCFRYDPKWKSRDMVGQIIEGFKSVFSFSNNMTADKRRQEYYENANKFKGILEGTSAKLADMGFHPYQFDAQDLIDLMFPLLNRRSIKGGKYKRGRNTNVAVPVYDPQEILTNQISETKVDHPENGIIKKDGRVYRTVSMVETPKQCLPLMIAPLQCASYENILSVTYSKDSQQEQIKKLDQKDAMLGFREVTARGRANQKALHRISAIRAARAELYASRCQIVRVGVHQTFICQNEDEAKRATSEAIATISQINGARGMVHEISDLATFIHSLPAMYDPEMDGEGWTVTLRSSRASRLYPIYGNWRGTRGKQFLLPSLWNRELVGFDLYDSNIAPNVLISGVSGAGKSYLLCYMLITLARGHFASLPNGQSVEKPPITFVFDKGMTGQPCGFEKVAKLFGGRIYEATPSKAPAMNFLARLGRTAPDPRNEDYKDLIDMCADIICDMAVEGSKQPGRLEKNVVVASLVEAHRLYRNGPMRREFILSDAVAVLRAPRRVDEDEDTAKRRQLVAMLIGDYYGDGTYARFFDRPGALKLQERFIVFDLKALSRNPDLQRVFLKVAMLWADTVMNDPMELDCRKILVFDEAHDLIGKTASGTVETAFRLYRKRKGIVIAASQSGEDFYLGEGGQAIVQNSAHKIFLKQDPSKFHMTAKAFNLSPQQADVILRLRTIKGLESQFYLISDIGESALVLPLEPAFYWVSTNNGDDNQLFADVLKQNNDDFLKALEQVVAIAPNGAHAFKMQMDTNKKNEINMNSFFNDMEK